MCSGIDADRAALPALLARVEELRAQLAEAEAAAAAAAVADVRIGSVAFDVLRLAEALQVDPWSHFHIERAR